MTDEVKSASRRTVLIGGSVMAALPLVLASPASAGVVTQKNAKYQDTPKGPAHCAICNYYIANPKNPKDRGTCKQVAGSISPNGWCQFYAKKPGAK